MDSDAQIGPSRDTTSGVLTGLVATVAVIVALPLLIVCVAFAAVLPGVPWWVGAPVAVIVSGLVVWWMLRNPIDRIVGRLDASPVDETRHARLINLVQGLALAEGVPEPDLMIIDDPARNVAVAARGDTAVIIATTGLLESLDLVSLEAVVAEAMVRIGNGDAEAAATGANLLGVWGSLPVASVLDPVVSARLQSALPEDRDLIADRDAVNLTRYPPGLYQALTAMADQNVTVRRARRADDALWMISPAQANGGRHLGPRSSLTLRLDILSEL
ncbi:MAG: hypothetical protein ACK5PP_11235 [Acidimicrobiales bacterium]